MSFGWVIADVLASLLQLQLALQDVFIIIALPEKARTFLACVLDVFQPRDRCERLVSSYNPP